MATVQPNLKWYTDISAAKNLTPRCPFASVYRCPRYYASISLLSRAGMTTSLDSEEDQRLLEKWKRSDLWPVTAEQDSQVMGPDGRPSHFRNFCPEVSFDRFGWFASNLSYYADEIDVDVAHRNLHKEEATAHDWRWTWSFVKPSHYAECPLYSPLQLGVNDTKDKPQIGFNVSTSSIEQSPD
jgi:hypothetical protein